MAASLRLVFLILRLQACDCFKLAVVSKVIVDTISGVQRPGGGGVQAAAGARLSSAAEEAAIAFHAPVGRDFEASMLDPLSNGYRVDVSHVSQLDTVETTPGEIISYGDDDKMEYVPVGWDGWDTLCSWEPPNVTGYDALHVIVEGGGSGEVRSVLGAFADARAESPSRTLCIGVEPILHECSAKALDGLREVTRIATMCSPDLPTARCIAQVAAADDASEFTCRPADADTAVLSALRADIAEDGSSLAAMAAACFDELCMQPGAILAIRDGASGSYLYTRPSPTAPVWQWLADIGSREYEWLAHVPAAELEQVVDPTGAGNAYAGALCAQLAAGVEPERAAALATAVGAAFCREAEWAPVEPEEARRWVGTASSEVLTRLRVVVGREM